MITEWELYWILKLDDIRAALLAVFLLLLLGSLSSILVGVVLADSCCSTDEKRLSRILIRRVAPACVALFVLCGVANVFIPSTTQVAAIYVIPKVLTTDNVETVEDETGEVYGLFKKWLKEQVNEVPDEQR